jgi:hypothetical protein
MILAFSLQMVSQILVKMAAATKTEHQHSFVMYYKYCLGLMFFGLQIGLLHITRPEIANTA